MRDHSDDTNPNIIAARGQMFQRLANTLGIMSVPIWVAVFVLATLAAIVAAFPDIVAGTVLGVAVTCSGAACLCGIRAGQFQLVDETRKERKERQRTDMALGRLVAEVEQISARTADLVVRQDRATAAIAERIDGAIAEVDGKLAEAVAAAYRRGLVNGAQQLAPEAGRPVLRTVGEGDS